MIILVFHFKIENMKIISLSLLTTSLFLTSCKNENKTEDFFNDQKEVVNEEQKMDGHTSMNALDWQGTYEGTQPCSDCDGIFTEITINSDATFEMHSTRIMGDKKDKSTQKGTFQWDETGSAIALKVNEKTVNYKVGENKLILVDDLGRMMPETETSNYVLIKKVL